MDPMLHFVEKPSWMIDMALGQADPMGPAEPAPPPSPSNLNRHKITGLVPTDLLKLEPCTLAPYAASWEQSLLKSMGDRISPALFGQDIRNRLYQPCENRCK